MSRNGARQLGSYSETSETDETPYVTPKSQGGAASAAKKLQTMAAHSEVNGCGPIPPGSAWENGELVHGRSKDGGYYECESHSEFHQGRFTKV